MVGTADVFILLQKNRRHFLFPVIFEMKHCSEIRLLYEYKKNNIDIINLIPKKDISNKDKYQAHHPLPQPPFICCESLHNKHIKSKQTKEKNSVPLHDIRTVECHICSHYKVIGEKESVRSFKWAEYMIDIATQALNRYEVARGKRSEWPYRITLKIFTAYQSKDEFLQDEIEYILNEFKNLVILINKEKIRCLFITEKSSDVINNFQPFLFMCLKMHHIWCLLTEEMRHNIETSLNNIEKETFQRAVLLCHVHDSCLKNAENLQPFIKEMKKKDPFLINV
jgi:hypothetical protein